jgi:hypothetical protein
MSCGSTLSEWLRLSPGISRNTKMNILDMTAREFAQAIIPGLTDREADYILWNETAFPFNDVWSLRRQLEDVAKETNGEIYT